VIIYPSKRRRSVLSEIHTVKGVLKLDVSFSSTLRCPKKDEKVYLFDNFMRVSNVQLLLKKIQSESLKILC